jgi:crotonobetainyl-CoA:carnitine CoA-transferase CaiB-like acyl-CoA transferase
MAYQGGNMAATATMTGVLGARWHDIGQHIDVSLFEVHAGDIDRRMTSLLGYAHTGDPGYREEAIGIGVYPTGVIPCQDGYIQTLLFPAMWDRLLAAMGMPELNDDPRFADPIDRLDQEKRPEFMAIFQAWLNQHPRYEAMAKMQAERVPLTALNPPSAVLNDPHFRERGYFVEVDHPEAGPLPYTREPFRMMASPAVPVQRAPLLGEHTDTVLQHDLGLNAADLDALRRHGVV